MWREAIFPKKKGAALERSIPSVVRVYDRAYAGRTSSACNHRAKGRLLHLAWHALPHGAHLAYRRSAIGALCVAWLVFYPHALQLRCLFCATAYSFMELAFTAVERKQPYSSVAQFGVNLLYVPMLLDVYGGAVRATATAVGLGEGSAGALLYVCCFPLNVWLLELAQHQLLALLYGFNPAWCYKDYADERFDGVIRMGHAPAWIVLGFICFHVYPVLVALTEDAAW